MNILIVGEYYSENLGDGVICESIKRVIEEDSNYEKNIKILDILDISGRTGWKDEQTDVAINKLNLVQRIFNKSLLLLKKEMLVDELNRSRSLIENVKKYKIEEIDRVVFAGGQMFMDYFSIPIYFLVKYFSKTNTPIYFNCCGVGKNESRLRKLALKKAVNYQNVKYITLRDNLEEFRLNYNDKKCINIEKTYDAAFSIGKYMDEMKKNNKNIIGLGVMSHNAIKNNGVDIGYNQYLNIWKKIILELNKIGKQWEMFTNGSSGDYDFAKVLLNECGYDYKEKLCIRPTRPNQLIENISKYESIISFRLHSHIIAYSLGRESIGVKWDKKVNEFSEIINRQENFFDLNDKDIVDKIISRLEHKTNLNLYTDYNRKEIIHKAKESIILCVK